jgi:hypothetical protein
VRTIKRSISITAAWAGCSYPQARLCCLNLYVNLVCIIVCDLWVTGVVPIRSFLAGNLFDAQVINAMSLAFDDVCGELGLVKTAEDPATSAN